MFSFLKGKAAPIIDLPMDVPPPIGPAPSAPEQPAVEEYLPAPVCHFAGDEPVQALQMGRYGQIVCDPGSWAMAPKFKSIRAQALNAIDERFALVPDGFAAIALTINGETESAEEDVQTRSFYLARCCVTNSDYQKFVDAGAYENIDLWPEAVFPHLVGFKDRTGRPGPRHWRDGRHNQHLSDHPVVGICCAEAEAYARWAGYRLPTEAEWQMAASWSIRSEANSIRRYPWGDALDLACCNIWHSGNARTLPVQACPNGAAPNGVLQLIGNVWEWTASEFTGVDSDGRKVIGDMLMRTIRGGAFDTYFPWQATSAFRSGAPTLARAHNIGFRCAMDTFEA